MIRTGDDADFHQRDLYDTIERGDYPSWTLYMQIMPFEEARSTGPTRSTSPRCGRTACDGCGRFVRTRYRWAMLFQKRFWAGLADGTITVAFRRWKRHQVIAGRSYRAPGVILDVTAVTEVGTAGISDDDAKAAGFDDAASLLADLPGEPSRPIYRIEFTRSREPDPRAELAASDDLTEDDLAEIDKRLDRLDRASTHRAWTRETLRLIADHPARRAGDLAEMVGRERAPFKLDVRKLKNLGLTESLDIGYRLSPRGTAYLESLDSRDGPT